MIEFINEHGILLFLATSFIVILGTSALFYITLLVITFVLREFLRAKGILNDFIKWRTDHRIHSGKIKKKGGDA